MRELSVTKDNKMTKRLVIVLLGAACVGKTTIENKMIKELGFSPVDITTTRSARDDDPAHYRFVSDDEFEATKGFDFTIAPAFKYGYNVLVRDLSVVSFISPVNVDEFLDAMKEKDNVVVKVIKLTASEAEMKDCMESRNMADAYERAKAAYTGECQIDYTFHRDVALDNISDIISNYSKEA